MRQSAIDSGYDESMNLLSLILIAMAVIVAGCVFYVAWQMTSGDFEANHAKLEAKKEPGESKES